MELWFRTLIFVSMELMFGTFIFVSMEFLILCYEINPTPSLSMFGLGKP